MIEETIIKEFGEIVGIRDNGWSSVVIRADKNEPLLLRFDSANLDQVDSLNVFYEKCKEHNIGHVVFNNCIVEQNLFNVMTICQAKVYNKVGFLFCNVVPVNVDLSKYKSIKSLQAVNGLNVADREKLLENVLSYEVIDEVLEWLISNRKTPRRLDFSAVSAEDLDSLYVKYSTTRDSMYIRYSYQAPLKNIVATKSEYNNVKLGAEHVLRILTRSGFIGREVNHLEGFDLSSLNLAEAISKENKKRAENKTENISLTYAKFDHSSLKKTILDGVSAEYASFVEANMVHVILNNAKLTRANFNKAKLQEAELREAKLQEAKLQEAKLQKAKLNGANLDDAKLDGADLCDADIRSTSLKRVDLRSVKTNKGTLSDANTNIDGAKVSREQVEIILNLKEGELFFGRGRGDLRNLDLSGLDLSGLTFDHANLEGSNMSGTNLENAKFINSTNLNKTDLSNIKTNSETQFSEDTQSSGVRINERQVDEILSRDGYIGRKKGDLHELNLSKLCLSRKKFDNVNIKGTNFSESNLKDVSINGKIQLDEYTNFSGAKMDKNFIKFLCKKLAENVKLKLEKVDLSLIKIEKARKPFRKHYVKNEINQNLCKLSLSECIVNFRTVKYLLDKKIMICKYGEGMDNQIKKAQFKKDYSENSLFMLKTIQGAGDALSYSLKLCKKDKDVIYF